jgi:hypothetical protein
MFSRFWLAPAIAVPIVGALAFSAATPASAMPSYASPAISKYAGESPVQPIAYRYWRRHRYYGAGEGAAFAAAAFGMIAAIAASSSHDDCDWGECGDDYEGPYYGGWGGYRHWGGHHYWGGHAWHGFGHHAFANAGGGGFWWRHRRR